MAMPWIDAVRDSGRLTLHPATSITRGGWRMVFDEAVREFNRLAEANGLGVTLVRVPREDDAVVRVEAASRSIDRSYEGVAIRHAFSGTALHGYTALASRGGRIERAFVFLPSTPQVNTPRGMREVGDGVKLLIAVHELVHACGLSNADHGTDDLFLGVPQVDAGSRPAQDRVRIRYDLRMPPLVLGSDTARKIKEIW